MPSFTPETLRFLLDLRERNDKAWFDENRARYEAHWLAPARAFVEEIAPRLHGLSPDLHADPANNGSIMRIHRDTRFSKDKRPYKDHLDFMFWQGSGRSRECPGLMMRLSPDGLYLGGGKHGFDKDQLKAYRNAVAGPAGERLQAVLTELRDDGWDVGDVAYAKVPRGFPADHPRAELLRHGGVHAFLHLEPVPDVVYGSGLDELVMARFAAVHPVVDWLATEVFGG